MGDARLPPGVIKLLDQMEFLSFTQKQELSARFLDWGEDGPWRLIGAALAMGIENAVGEFRERLAKLEARTPWSAFDQVVKEADDAIVKAIVGQALPPGVTVQIDRQGIAPSPMSVPVGVYAGDGHPELRWYEPEPESVEDPG
jgi:hypothetical protein